NPIATKRLAGDRACGRQPGIFRAVPGPEPSAMQRLAAAASTKLASPDHPDAPTLRMRHVSDRAETRRRDRLSDPRGARHRRAERAGHAAQPDLSQRLRKVAAD